MIGDKSVLAVIPARAGSARCPGKNAMLYKGKPLVVWAIHQAKASKYVDFVLVSTNDEAVKKVCADLPCCVLDRPAWLCTPEASSESAIRHALEYFDVDVVVLLQPTSPNRTEEDIDACIEIAVKDGDGCISYRQDTSERNGAVYVARASLIKNGGNFNKPFRSFYMMPPERSLDIDYAEEFAL